MLKRVRFYDYNANYAYAPSTSPAVINTEEIVKAVLIPRENTRSAFDDTTRVWFKDGSHLDCVGLPEDFLEE